MAKSPRKSPPKFLKGKPIQNDKYRRIDAVSLAEDNIVIGINSKDLELDETIIGFI